MKIAVEIGWSHKPGGARRVAFRLLSELARAHPDIEWLLYANQRHDQIPAAVRQVPLPAPARIPQTIHDQILFPHLLVPWANQRCRPDLIHHTNNIVSLWGKTPAVVTIHDMTPFVLPSSFHGAHAAYQRAYFRLAARRAARIITVSECSKQDICRILKVPEDMVVVAPLAAEFTVSKDEIAAAWTSLQRRFALTEPFILYAGAIHPRKNVGRVIEAYHCLRRTKKIPHTLVLAGAERWQANLPQTPEGGIIRTGPVSDAALAALYTHCALFIWPSLYEGFGLPVLEAMSFGAPVITADRSSLPEVAGDAALLVDPENVHAIAEAMGQILTNSALAASLAAKGRKRARRFSWERSAAVIWRAYQEAL